MGADDIARGGYDFLSRRGEFMQIFFVELVFSETLRVYCYESSLGNVPSGLLFVFFQAW